MKRDGHLLPEGAEKLAGGEARLAEQEPPDQAHHTILIRAACRRHAEAFCRPALTLEFAHALQHAVKYHFQPGADKCSQVVAKATAKWSAHSVCGSWAVAHVRSPQSTLYATISASHRRVNSAWPSN